MTAPTRGCSVGDCGTKHYARSMCARHYQAWRKHGDPTLGAKAPQPQGVECVVDDCHSIPLSRQMCSRHYQRWAKYGNPLAFIFHSPDQTARLCGECGVSIEHKPRNAAYCSNRCADIAWRKSANGLLHQHRRRNALAGVESFPVTDRDLSRLRERQRHACCYCGERRKLTVEHIIPILRGGRHAIGNLALACGSCNSSKGSHLLTEWRHLRAERTTSAA